MHVGSLWHTEPGGTLAMEAEGVRLVVQNVTTAGGHVRFMVLRRPHGQGSKLALVASGIKDDMREAMEAAERVAGGIASRG